MINFLSTKYSPLLPPSSSSLPYFVSLTQLNNNNGSPDDTVIGNVKTSLSRQMIPVNLIKKQKLNLSGVHIQDELLLPSLLSTCAAGIPRANYCAGGITVPALFFSKLIQMV